MRYQIDRKQVAVRCAVLACRWSDDWMEARGCTGETVVTGTLRRQTSGAYGQSCHQGPSCTREIGGGESAG